jgi:hypothetical protein
MEKAVPEAFVMLLVLAVALKVPLVLRSETPELPLFVLVMVVSVKPISASIMSAAAPPVATSVGVFVLAVTRKPVGPPLEVVGLKLEVVLSTESAEPLSA